MRGVGHILLRGSTQLLGRGSMPHPSELDGGWTAEWTRPREGTQRGQRRTRPPQSTQYWADTEKKGGPEPLEFSDLKAVKKIYSRLSLSSKINSWRRRTPELMKTSILGPSLRKWKQLAYVHGRHRCSETPEGCYGIREDGA